MADDNTVIEGTVKFRDGKKWKSRWCVMRKLSPVADCLHLQLYRDSKERYKKGQTKASLSLQQYLGFETGFTLDKESNTIAIICQDVTVVLAFETRERLIQWQVKVGSQLGEPRNYLVLAGGGAGAGAGRKLAAGPVRLHIHARRFALTAGVPPRLLGLWELGHLRRYGVIEGRFCFEGGSHCGKGEGLHVFITDQAHEITYAFDLAAQGQLSPKKRPVTNIKLNYLKSPTTNKAYRSDTRLSDLNTIESAIPPNDLRIYEDQYLNEDGDAVSPYWPQRDMGLGDTSSVNETIDSIDSTPWNGSNNITLERCVSCFSKLGALSRSSTAALTPGATNFNPAWTMEAVHESTHNDNHTDSDRNQLFQSSQKIDATDVCRCLDTPPNRPPKPIKIALNIKKPPMPLPFSDVNSKMSIQEDVLFNVGPYENYDIPKLPVSEVDIEYYDTPKRIKENLDQELFKISKTSNAGSLILKKPCGCLLKFGKKNSYPKIVDADDNFQQPNCPCQKVTNWAQSWINIPYCKRKLYSSIDNAVPNKENLMPNITSQSDLYATVDISRKTKKTNCLTHPSDDRIPCNPKNMPDANIDIDEGPLANYENLNFALSLEYYENAKDVLRNAGLTQVELEAIRASLNIVNNINENKNPLCLKCGHAQTLSDINQVQVNATSSYNDDYLIMAPDLNDAVSNVRSKNKISSSPGYTPMSPIGTYSFNTLKNPTKQSSSKILEEKSASNPSLFECTTNKSFISEHIKVEKIKDLSDLLDKRDRDRIDRIKQRKRSCSADSSRFLEDVKEFDSSVDSHGSSSSIETLRNMAADNVRTSTNYSNKDSICDDNCCTKYSAKNYEIKYLERSEELPQLRNRQRQTSQIKRSSSVPCKVVPNRDSSSSNDSGVSSCSLKPGPEFYDFELPLTTANTRYHYLCVQKLSHVARSGCLHSSLPRRSKSTDPLRDISSQLKKLKIPTKSSSAEAEVPVMPVKTLRVASIVDSRSTSSGTSDMSDYIETLSLCSSHSSTDTPTTLRLCRQSTCRLRPRSGSEYRRRDPRLAPPPLHLHSAAPHRQATNPQLQ